MPSIRVHTKQQTRTISSFSIEVLNRLLNVLIENGKTKKTNLAGKTKLNYLVCMKYIGFLRAAAWIRFTKDPDGEYLSITQKGREFETFLSNYLEGNELEPDVLDDLENSLAVSDRPETSIPIMTV